MRSTSSTTMTKKKNIFWPKKLQQLQLSLSNKLTLRTSQFQSGFHMIHLQLNYLRSRKSLMMWLKVMNTGNHYIKKHFSHQRKIPSQVKQTFNPNKDYQLLSKTWLLIKSKLTSTTTDKYSLKSLSSWARNRRNRQSKLESQSSKSLLLKRRSSQVSMRQKPLSRHNQVNRMKSLLKRKPQ